MWTQARSVEWVCTFGLAIAAACPASADDEAGGRVGLLGRLEGEENQPRDSVLDLRSQTPETIAALTLEERAKLIDELQRGHTDSNAERAATAILLGSIPNSAAWLRRYRTADRPSFTQSNTVTPASTLISRYSRLMPTIPKREKYSANGYMVLALPLVQPPP